MIEFKAELNFGKLHFNYGLLLPLTSFLLLVGLVKYENLTFLHAAAIRDQGNQRTGQSHLN